MKGTPTENISLILKQSYLRPVDRKDAFWSGVNIVLSSMLREVNCPDFLAKWIKETLAVLNEPSDVNISLVLSKNGSYGIYIKDREKFLFSYNDGSQNIYISKRFFDYLRRNNDYKTAAAVVLHEATELIMCKNTIKKGHVPNISKIHGEALRVESKFMGETEIESVFENMVELEFERNNVTINSKDMFVSGCAIDGEEIVAEIASFSNDEEKYIIPLAYGERKTVECPAGGGEGGRSRSFTVETKQFDPGFTLENIDFDSYCSFMKAIDDFYISEKILDGPFLGMLEYIRSLDYFREYDNALLRIIHMLFRKYCKNKVDVNCILYNFHLIIQEYNLYFRLLERIKTRYWAYTRYVKDNINEIIAGFENYGYELAGRSKHDQNKIKDFVLGWFSRADTVPLFLEIDKWTSVKMAPLDIQIKNIKNKKTILSKLLGGNILKELFVHQMVIEIMKDIEGLKQELRAFRGIKRQDDSKICEITMIRTHFYGHDRLFGRGDRLKVYTEENKNTGIVEVLDVADNSLIIALQSIDSYLPESGYLQKFGEEDESINAQLEAIKNITETNSAAAELLKIKSKKRSKVTKEAINFFNKSVLDNISQKEAVSDALSESNITLIQGPPGTGKTTVIAEIVLQYLRRGRRVLLSSQTHNAVDNALDNIMRYVNPVRRPQPSNGAKQDKGIARVASAKEKITDHNIKKIWLKGKRELERFESVHPDGLVIGATNVGTHTLALMKEKEFDVLVMDEAGKSNIVESVLPMLLLKKGGKLVIVGDHMQGMPFSYDDNVLDLFVKKYGIRGAEKGYFFKEKINESLFKKLIQKGIRSAMLNLNYRSEPEIVDLISKLFYNNKLLPAKTKTRKSKSIVVVDTSKIATPTERTEIEGAMGRGYCNAFEAKLLVKEVKELLRHRYIHTGVKSRYVTGVTILAPYIAQVEEIRRALSAGLANALSHSAIEDLLNNTNTIDSFQGREDDIIIISFTRSNKDPNRVGFLNEFNRINVALSRAKRKMVLIGDFHTLCNAKSGINTKKVRGIFDTIYNSK